MENEEKGYFWMMRELSTFFYYFVLFFVSTLCYFEGVDVCNLVEACLLYWKNALIYRRNKNGIFIFSA